MSASRRILPGIPNGQRSAFRFPSARPPGSSAGSDVGSLKLEKTSLDEVILALENNTSPDKPFYVEIQDDEAEERVQVFIG